MITQAIAYEGIANRRNLPPQIVTTNNLKQTRIALREYQGSLETDETIWRSIVTVTTTVCLT